ncbi:MAG: FecCD family ABC transporter permease [Nitrospirales bacterium]
MRNLISQHPRVEQVMALSLRRWCLWMLMGGGLAGVIFLVCLSFGSEPIHFSRILSVFLQAVVGEPSNLSPGDPSEVILLHVRLPRLMLAFFVGGSLSMVGVALQALLRNPLADPFIIGISSGAALGAAMALLLGLGAAVGTVSALPVCAFLGALGSLLLVYRLSATHAGFSVYTLLLAGVVVNAIFSAFILFLTSVADPNKTFGMYAWLMGTLTGPDFVTLMILGGYLVLGLGFLAAKAQALNLMTLGEETARSLGVEVERVKKIVFLMSALVTGAVVAFSGLIGFVGLIVPHAIRLGVSADHRLLMPLSGLVGGAFLMVADTVARTLLSPIELPVGVVTALVGGPIFLYLLMQRRVGRFG